MSKHMKELTTMKRDALLKLEHELKEEIVTIQKSIKMGNTQNYRAAGEKRRHLARVKMLLSRELTTEEVTTAKIAKEKK